MKFRTEYEAKKAPFFLNPEVPVVVVGSCFTQNIASRMEAHNWQFFNPAGTLYNPISIAYALDMMLDEETGLSRFEESLFEYNGLWNSHWFDSSFSSIERQDCIKEFLNRKQRLATSLNEGKVLIVTFGTSICYYLQEDHVPVGNCHKQPSTLFYKERLGISEIESYWTPVIKRLQEKIENIRIIFTVSPVRHLKDGFEGNARSKAILLLGIEEICRNNDRCFYFPAYEILTDDLRDYRFYASDLVHPSDEGINYIWEKFVDTFIDDNGRKQLLEGEKIVKAINHRPKTGALGKPLKA